MEKLKVLDLFSGIGGFSLGLERTGGFETVAFCEIEEFPRKVLAKHWPEVPCFEDVRKLKGEDVGAVDVICGGYPCQPFSTAGKRRGKEDDRHLWPEFMRLVVELRPSWVIGENVAGHISMGLDDVLSDLEGHGYSARPFVIPACALGAHHRRDRTWTIAHASDVLQPGKLDDGRNRSTPAGSQREDKRQREASHGKRLRAEFGTGAKDVADAEGDGQSISRSGHQGRNADTAKSQQLPAELGGRGTSLQSKPLAHTKQQRCGQVVASKFGRPTKEGAASQAEYSGFSAGWDGWITEPNVGRVASGVSNRVDRLRALGNAVVPQIPEMIGHAILEAHQ